MSERRPYRLLRPCRACGCPEGSPGTIERVGLQDVVRCASGHHVYNASRVETGEKPVSLQSCHEAITPRKRARIIDRALGRCEACGSKELLTVGHLLSVDEGMKAGLTEEEINSEQNLSAMCAECNSGFGSLSISPTLFVAILRARISHDRFRGADR